MKNISTSNTPVNKPSSFVYFTVAFLLSISNSYALSSSDTFSAANFASIPPTTVDESSTTEPLVMLVMGNDHQLYYKGYNDWTDLDGDGIVDHTYKNSIDYYGYFDSYKCYGYDSTSTPKHFFPIRVTTDKYCNSGGATGEWSGNFLNWASMTRMDIVRKVLYGGKRIVDTNNTTILERAFIPLDAHSFAKFYGGPDLGQLTPFNYSEGLTLCNTTYHDGTSESQDVTDPPLIRAARGDFRYWNANERWQCTWDTERGRRENSSGINKPPSAGVEDPIKATDGATYGTLGPDFEVHIKACASSSLIGREKCKIYGSNLKPIGLLHAYGEDDKIKFGLLTGSYRYNKSGGVVRKDISSFSDEVYPNTGIFTGVDGIVTTLDKFRITRYEYGSGYYNGSDNCPWGLTWFPDGQCSNWGNPATEMYLEAVRYFAGLNRNPSFSNSATDDNAYISGLTNVGTWTDPLNSDNYCAACNIIVLNTSELTYDSDSLSMTGLGTPTPDPVQLTNTIGGNNTALGQEDIAGKQWFVGETASETDQLCIAKTINNFGDARGLCPNAPRLEGTYNMSGISYWAHTNDIRPLTGTQRINTYAVALSPAVPKIEIPVPSSDKFVTILPACRNVSLSPDANCAIVNFTIVEEHQETTPGSGVYKGVFAIHWEDSEQGGDYDQDMKGYISYEITDTSIKVETDVDRQSAIYSMGFGFIISGTTQDGFHVYSGINHFDYTDPDITIPGCSDCDFDDPAMSYTFTIGDSSARLLEDPLWYAAKWGGFTDLNYNDVPDDVVEWDNVINDTGLPGSDGIPDNYFLANNPATLEKQLGKVFISISQRLSAGTSAAVVANSISGTGVIYQALYQPKMTSIDDSQQISWVGLLHSMFIDNYSQLREDTNGNAQLDDTSTDYILEIFYDTLTNRARVARYSSPDGGITRSLVGVVELRDIASVWNASNELGKLTNLTSQRTYDTKITPSTGRYIFTWLDNGTGTDAHNGVVNAGEVVDFVSGTFTTSNYGYLNILKDTDSDTDIDVVDAQNIVNYIRGDENVAGTNFRSRTIDYNADGTDEVYLLGDIIHSSPAVLGPPADSYDGLYGDSSYRDFRNQYLNRRQVIFVGANDGMLHAFNGGFYNSSTKGYDLTRPAETYETSAPPSHPLGAELWAYVPKNLLPHLQWLADPTYPHVYYVDGDPKLFDVNIFPDDTTHPQGWGTILVATMRLGGGANAVDSADTTIDVDIDYDGTAEYTARSAVIILDVTDPEKPPVLLAEYTDTQLGFTTSTPTIVVQRKPSATGSWDKADVTQNDWYLVFGSGPTDLKTVTSTQNALIYAMNINNLATTGSALTVTKIDTTVAKNYVGQIHSVDWNYNYLYDSIYFGTVGLKGMTRTTSPETPATLSFPVETDGRLMRLLASEKATGPFENPLSPASWSLSTVLNSEQAFSSKPATLTDIYGKKWIFAGTGRLMNLADNKSNTVESFYGIKETMDNDIGIPVSPTGTTPSYTRNTATTPDPAKLTNVTGVEIDVNGGLYDTLSVLDSSITSTPATFAKLESHIQGTAGWYRDFESTTDASGATIHTRSFTDPTIYRIRVLFTSYQPPLSICLPEGTGYLSAVYFGTGTSYPNAGLENTIVTTGVSMTLDTRVTGIGIAASPKVFKGGPTLEGSAIISTGTGLISGTKLPPTKTSRGRQSWREILAE